MMLKSSFHYSPFNKFGEYKFEFNPNQKDCYLTYRFEYPTNKGAMAHRFMYDVFEGIEIEDSIVTESFKNMTVEDNLTYLEGLKELQVEDSYHQFEKTIEVHTDRERALVNDYAGRVRDLFSEDVQRRLERVISLIAHGTSIEDVQSKVDHYDYKNKRVSDMRVEKQAKMDISNGETKRVMGLNLEEEYNKLARDTWHHSYFSDIQTQLKKASNKNIAMVDGINIGVESVSEIIRINKSDLQLKVYKDIHINSDKLLESSKNIKIEDEEVILEILKGVHIVEQRVMESVKNVHVEKESLFTRDITRYIDNEVDKVKGYWKNNEKEVSLEGLPNSMTKDSVNREIEIIQSETVNDKQSIRYVDIRDGHTKVEKETSRNMSLETHGEFEKSSKDILHEKETSVAKAPKDFSEEDEDEGQSLHKRLWFLQHHGKIDYKVLPNTDFDYPIDLRILESPIIEGVYKYSYTSYFSEVDGDYEVVAYNDDFNFVGRHIFHLHESYENTKENIEIKAQMISYAPDKHQVNFDIYVHHSNVSYFVIRQPKDVYGNFFSFTIGEKILSERHPIPIGHDLGINEIPISINIMVDFVNMILLMWSKFYPRFVGYQGVQAVDGMVNTVHEWVTLETSLENAAIDDYHRCYRWLRWEAEKVMNKAKYDPDLSGNLWVEEVIFEMIDYMEMHHFNIVPEWYDIANMEEHRNSIFTEVDFDIPIILDKVKGIRKRVLTSRKIKDEAK